MSETTETLPILNPDRLPACAPKGINLSKIIEYRNKGLSYQEIGNILGCTKQNISDRLKDYQTSIDNLKSIKENRADTLTVVSDVILNSLTVDEIKKISPGSRVTAYGILYDKERLERGQSTANVAYADLSRSINDLDKEIETLEAELGSIEDD